MARSRAGTKSHAIQEYLAANKQAMPQQIVDALKEQGIKVSFGLASAVKYKKAGKDKTTARKARRVAAVKNGVIVTGSESIRQFIAKHPKAGPNAIAAGLEAKGIQVSKALISAVKYSKARKSGKKVRKMSRPATVRVAARATAAVELTVEQLLEVKNFADAFGGSDQVRRSLEILAQLR